MSSPFISCHEDDGIFILHVVTDRLVMNRNACETLVAACQRALMRPAADHPDNSRDVLLLTNGCWIKGFWNGGEYYRTFKMNFQPEHWLELPPTEPAPRGEKSVVIV